MTFELPAAKSVAVNPTQAEMRAWALELMDDATLTEFDNVNYKARILSRQGQSSFFISDTETGKPTKSRAFYDEWAAKQDAFIAEQEMILVEGYIGPDPEFRTGSRLFIEKCNANIPAMQQQLYFPLDDADFNPEFTVIYTPSLRAPEFGGECLILTDL
ncbi:MAG: phosphoenolpyruvate carboxykinase (ATP), partial [Nitriliruptoraceae bacterium]